MALGSQGSKIVSLRADELPGDHARPCCRRCQAEDGYLARYIHSNGRSSLRWACNWCHDVYTSLDLPYELLGPNPNLNELPPINRSLVDNGLPPCEICDGEATEWHHWAPQSIFREWPDVPIPTCKEHHDDWHERMRAHGLRWPHELKGKQ